MHQKLQVHQHASSLDYHIHKFGHMNPLIFPFQMTTVIIYGGWLLGYNFQRKGIFFKQRTVDLLVQSHLQYQ